MSFLKQSKNSSYLILGGGLLALGLGTVAYVLKSQKKDDAVEGVALDRTQVIKILKELRKEMFTVFTNFSMVSMQIKQQTQGKARPEEVKAMLLEQPMFNGEIRGVEDSVYDSFGITREHFQHVCETQFSQDPEVRALQQDMKDSFEKSFTGIPPDCKVEIPVFLTAALTFQILEKVMIESAVKLNQKLLEFQESGEEVSFNNPKLMQVMQQLKMDSSKKDILSEYGLDKYDESAQKILQYATQQYQMSNADNFGQKMSQLDAKYQQTMEKLLTTGPITEIMLRKSMVIDVAPFAGMGMAGMRKQPSQTKTSQGLEQSSQINEESKEQSLLINADIVGEKLEVPEAFDNEVDFKVVVDENEKVQEPIVSVQETVVVQTSLKDVLVQQTHLVQEEVDFNKSVEVVDHAVKNDQVDQNDASEEII